MCNRILTVLFLWSAIAVSAQDASTDKGTKPAAKKINSSVSVIWEGNYAVKVYIGKKEVDLDAKDSQTVSIPQGSYHLKMESLNKTFFAEQLLNLKPGHSFLSVFVTRDTLQFTKETDIQRKQRLEMEAGKQKMHADSMNLGLIAKEKYDSIQNNKVTKEKSDSIEKQKNLLLQIEKEKLGIGKTVTIGVQVWTAVNLNVCNFRNGDSIPQARTPEDWRKAENAGTPSWCYPAFDSSNGRKFGKLYNWYAVQDQRGLAPAGWHIPTNDEWEMLITNLGGSDAGKKAKNSSGWDADGNGNNSSGFSALATGKCTSGDFSNTGKNAYFWTASKGSFYYSWAISLGYDNPAMSSTLENNSSGFSCRCVKNN